MSEQHTSLPNEEIEAAARVAYGPSDTGGRCNTSWWAFVEGAQYARERIASQSKYGMARTDACGYHGSTAICGRPRAHEVHRRMPSEAYDAPEFSLQDDLDKHAFVGEPIVQAKRELPSWQKVYELIPIDGTSIGQRQEVAENIVALFEAALND